MTEHSDRGRAEPEHANEDAFLEERKTLNNEYPQSGGGLPPAPVKSRWIAVLLSLFPGVGHFYLGLMSRGLLFMLLFFLDIAGIVYFSIGSEGPNILLIVLCGLLIPVIYFYNLFDALHATDRVNRQAQTRSSSLSRRESPAEPPPAEQSMETSQPKPVRTPQETAKGRNAGLLLVVIGAVLLFMIKKPDLLQYWNGETGTYVGAAILIGAGVILFLRDRRK
jgi:hypothetical protein